MSVLEDEIAKLEQDHQSALRWFHERIGEEVAWPGKFSPEIFLLNKAKGIHKPAGWKYALSVRVSLGGPYDNKDVTTAADGTWTMDYFQEGDDPNLRDEDYTNKALMMNLEDNVPVGVVIQTKKKPNPRYRILGLAKVRGWAGGYFELNGYSAAGSIVPAENAGQTSKVISALNSVPTNISDARKRINVAIVARQGAGAFRAVALETFSGHCAVTDCDSPQALEAAHIVPYLGEDTNARENTLLLRADIHTLFDRSLISIDEETLKVRIAPALRGTSYETLEGRAIALPTGDHSGWKHWLKLRNSME